MSKTRHSKASSTSSLVKAVDEFFDACGSKDDGRIAACTTDDANVFWPMGTSVSWNLRHAQCEPRYAMVGGIAMDKYAIQIGRMRLIKRQCRLFDGCALVTGFAKGDIVCPTKPRESKHAGVWRVSMVWSRKSGDWKLEHLDMSDLLQFQYLTYLPKDYKAKSSKKWPLILFLHGSGQRGSNLREVATCALPQVLETDNTLPFITICPQCPSELRWPMLHESLKMLIDEAVEKFNVDTTRIYLTGNSMGGNGVWSFASAYPSLFAAIAPVCGRTDGADVRNLKDMPIWVFHGENDKVVPVEYSRDFVQKLEKYGNHVKLTIYPGITHDSWTQAYNNRQLYKWFLGHARKP